jgi:type II secretory pathway component GspD/PulD (secretin)
MIAVLMLCCALAVPVHASVDITLRDVEISEAMEMLSKREQVNIILAEGVQGKISVNLYGVSIGQAVRMVADAAGYAVDRRGRTYYVLKREELNNYTSSAALRLKTYRLRYAKADDVAAIAQEYLSSYGAIRHMSDRNLVVVEDKADFLRRIDRLIAALDYKPKQILIEARILEVRLDDSEAFGVEWSKLFDGAQGEGTNGSFGTRGMANTTSPGFFVNLSSENLRAMLDALESEGRARTLTTPTLLTVENEPASVIVGNRLGYRNTVTINQVTTESTEFLESGVILEVTPAIDDDGSILLDIHPEVSTGTVTEGVPSQDTTSVETKLIVPDGATSFIGGLMRSQRFEDHRGVPVLGRVPVAGRLFSRKEQRNIRTEIIVLITPRIVDTGAKTWQQPKLDLFEREQQHLPGDGTSPTEESAVAEAAESELIES